MLQDEDDYEEEMRGAFENGAWVWNENLQQLEFVSNFINESEHTFKITAKTNISTIQFKDDIDFIEQIRFRRIYQRKLLPDEEDVVTVQDIKDLVLFTAPITVLSPMLINFLHTSTAERLIRSLIFYMQYYLQVADKMIMRTSELQTKIRTPQSSEIEATYRENLSDLRLLIAREYSVLILGGDDLRKYHHMDADKKSKSLHEKDAKLYETMLQVLIQIVWLALGRSSFNRIELELNRLMKTEVFNSAEHNLKTKYLEKLSKTERNALLGRCYKHNAAKVGLHTPMMDEMFCEREVDYRMLGLGIIQSPVLSYRHFYMMAALSVPEEDLAEFGVTVGILGISRSRFDTMLKPVTPAVGTSSTVTKSVLSNVYSAKKVSKLLKSRSSVRPKIFGEIMIPAPDDETIVFPDEFPTMSCARRHCSDIQRRKWLNRLQKRLLTLSKNKSGISLLHI